MDMDGSDYEDPDFVDDYDDHDRVTGGKRTKAGGYQLTNVLKLPRATTYSTQALYGLSRLHARNTVCCCSLDTTDQVHAGDIDLEPEYQRGTSCHCLLSR